VAWRRSCGRFDCSPAGETAIVVDVGRSRRLGAAGQIVDVMIRDGLPYRCGQIRVEFVARTRDARGCVAISDASAIRAASL